MSPWTVKDLLICWFLLFPICLVVSAVVGLGLAYLFMRVLS